MTIAERKLSLLRQIMEVDDEVLLSQLDNILSNSSRDFADDLTDEQLESIERGKRQLEEGKGIPMEKVLEKLQNRRR